MRLSQTVLEWQAEARADTQIETILLWLNERFSEGIPPDVVAAVRGVHDPEKLTRWLKAVVKVSSLDEFRHLLNNGSA